MSAILVGEICELIDSELTFISARYSKSSRTVVYTNIFSLSILLTLCAILGVVVTSATEVIYGKATWNPLQVSSLMGNRAAQFFTALMWGFAVFSTNSMYLTTAQAEQG
jgi:NCS1 family nucleobase:cation symporter-1